MDFFRGIGDWFRGAFGGNDDEKKKKRQPQQQQPVRLPTRETRTPQQIQVANDLLGKKTPTQMEPESNKPKLHLQANQPEKPKLQLAQPAQKPDLAPPKVKPIKIGQNTYTPNKDGTFTSNTGQRRTSEQLRQLSNIETQSNIRQKKIDNNDFWGKVGAVASAPGKVVVEAPANFLKDMIEGAGKLGEDIGVGKIQQSEAAKKAQNQGSNILYGNEALVRSRREAIDEGLKSGSIDAARAKQMHDELDKNVATASGVVKESEQKWGQAIPGDDELGTKAMLLGFELWLGGGASFKSLAQAGGDKLIKPLTEYMKSRFGGKLTKKQADEIAEYAANVEKEAAKETATTENPRPTRPGEEAAEEVIEGTPSQQPGQTPKPGTETPQGTPTQPPASNPNRTPNDIVREELGNYNRFVEENPGLTNEQLLTAQEATQKRIKTLIDELEESRRVADETVETQGQALDETIDNQQQVNQEVADQQAAVNTPQPGDQLPPEPNIVSEVDANNVYIRKSDLSTDQSGRTQELTPEQSPEVTPERFMEHREAGRRKLENLTKTRRAPEAIDNEQSWTAMKGDAFGNSRNHWDGETYDVQTGEKLPKDIDAYAVTIRDPGMDTVSLSPSASQADFNQAMEIAKQKYRHILEREGVYLGVFNDADTGMVEIDPVLITGNLEDVHDIGAYTRSTGGAYHFKSGDGFWAPHIADDAVPVGGGAPTQPPASAYGTDEYFNAQAAKANELRQNPWRRFFNRVQQAIVDPRTVQQRYDNAEFKRLQKAGLIKRGQREVEPEQAMAVLQGRIENPSEPVQVRISTKINVDGREISVKDLLKKYGADDKPKAQDFANYRLFKDELEQIERGTPPSLGIDPAAMDDFVKRYEAQNPDAIADNAALRAFALENMRRRVDAGIDSAERFQNSASLEFYSPRTTVSPDDITRPRLSGAISGSPKGTQARGETAPVSHSPLSLYYNDAIQTERAVATQQRNLLIKDRADRGEAGFNIEIDAEKAVAHRDALRNVRDLADRIASMKNVRGKAKKDVKHAKQAEATKVEAAGFVRQFLKEQMPDSRFGDIAPLQQMDEATYRTQKSLAETDYARSVDAVMKDPMTDQARKQALKEVDELHQARLNELETQRAGVRDTSAVDEMTDDEALELLEVMADVGAKGSKRVAQRLAKQSGLSVDEAEDFLRGVQNEMKEMRDQSSRSWADAMENSQHLERDVQTVTYKVDGETGKVRIPADLAEELARNNELVNRNGLEKVWGGLANAVKITWTGALAPVFRTYQIGKNLALAYRNADGLSGIDHNALGAFVGQIFQTPKIRQFKKDMMLRGANYENALQTKNVAVDSAADIAARANLITFFNRNPVRSFGDIWKGLNHGLSYVDNAQRTAVAYGAYKRALRAGFDDAAARQIASQAPAKVFGDFNRISRLAQNMETILPYSGAIQAGARAMAQASRQKPIQTTLKDATIIAGVGGFAAYSMFNNREYYDDMIAAGKEYELDNNVTLVLPGASKDDEGNWSGVIKIPMTPDFRPFNRATWQTIYAQTDGDPETGIDPGMIAYEIFNEFTGDMSNSIYDPERTNEGANPVNGVLSGSPVGNMFKVAAGVNPRTGEPLAEGRIANLPRDEQAHEGYTSDNARAISGGLGGFFTPLQIDAFADQLGGFGDTIQNRPEEGEERANPLSKFFDFGKPVRPGKGLSEDKASGRQFYENLETVKQEFAGIVDDETFKEFESLYSTKDKDRDKNMLNSSKRAVMYMNYTGDGAFTTTPVYEMAKRLDQLGRENGQPGNPLFDLPPQALQKVLTYRQGKIYNAAKQNYTKGGEGAFQSLGLDEKWYSDFRKAESDFYSQIKKEDAEDTYYTFSGEKKPKLTAEQEQLEDVYYSLPKGTGQRKAFLQANPWLLDHWAASNDFTNEERKALGFSVIADDEFSSSSGGGSGYGGYGRGGGQDPYGNLLGELTNYSGGIKRYEVGEPEAMPNLAQLFATLQAAKSGGRAKPRLGASSRGQ